MTNFEHYREDIEKLSCLGNLAFDGKSIKECSSITCNFCKFNGKDCSQKAIKWLYSEYNEPPTLNEAEHYLCKALGTGWIACEKTGDVFVHTCKPRKVFCNDKSTGEWLSSSVMRNISTFKLINPSIKFNFITWNDKHPWSIEDLLKLDVKNT